MSSHSDAGRPPSLRWLRAFGGFWWEFLVGDTPELTIAIAVVVGVTITLATAVSKTAAWITLPVLVIATLVLSVLRGRKHS